MYRSIWFLLESLTRLLLTFSVQSSSRMPLSLNTLFPPASLSTLIFFEANGSPRYPTATTTPTSRFSVERIAKWYLSPKVSASRSKIEIGAKSGRRSRPWKKKETGARRSKSFRRPRPKLEEGGEEGRRRGRRSRANISTTSCRVHLAVISSAATGFPQLFIESDTDTDANCNDGRQFGCCHILPPFLTFAHVSVVQPPSLFSSVSSFANDLALESFTRHLLPITRLRGSWRHMLVRGWEKVVFVVLTNEYLLCYL